MAPRVTQASRPVQGRTESGPWTETEREAADESRCAPSSARRALCDPHGAFDPTVRVCASVRWMTCAPRFRVSSPPSCRARALTRLSLVFAVLLQAACSAPAADVGPGADTEADPATSQKDAGKHAGVLDGGASKADAARAQGDARAAAQRDARAPSSASDRDAGVDTDDGEPVQGEDDAPEDDDAGASGDAGGSAPSGKCGTGKRNGTPFGCSFAWGTNQPDGPLAPFKDLSFVSKWVGYELDKNGALPRCDGCSWLTQEVAPTAVVPVYYAYFIGYLGAANGFADQDRNPNGPNLATDGAKLIRDQRAKLIEIYASYAKQTQKVWPDKPLVWLLEGDFVQYTYKEQKSPLSLAELGELARDITCAIKGNMPSAVVAINHSTWLSDELTNGFWDAMSAADYDMVWTTGVANNSGFLEAKATPDVYNHATATFAYLSKKTGRKLLIDQGYGLSAMTDTWSTATPETLGQRIADGVIAVNAGTAPPNYVNTVKSLTPKLSSVCK